MKDYYVILGVLPDAEDIVIKAAYKALVQRYHPDRYKGNAQEAQRKTAELNEAYEVLSNPQKRADYDRSRKASQGSTSDYDDTDTSDSYGVNDLDQDWAVVVQYYPDLTQLEERLRKISIALSIGFKQAMLETKDFDKRQKIAKILEQRFLENYFGSNKKVIDFALKIILDGKKEGAKELNRTINVIGSKADPTPVIEKLYEKYYAVEIAVEKIKNEEVKAKQKAYEKRRAYLLVFSISFVLISIVLNTILVSIMIGSVKSSLSIDVLDSLILINFLFLLVCIAYLLFRFVSWIYHKIIQLKGVRPKYPIS